jgi:small subunit ribosomal protein S3e
MASVHMNKKKKFVNIGMMNAELSELLRRELGVDGFSSVDIRISPQKTDIVIRAAKPLNVLGVQGRRIRELQSVIQKRFKLNETTLEVLAEKVHVKGLSAAVQAERLKYSLIGGMVVRKACYSAIRTIMDAGAKGCEVQVNGKLRAQRAKGMTFRDGYMVKSGQPVRDYQDKAIRHVFMRQGILGVVVKIMLPWDVTGKIGPKNPQPDVVNVLEPKEDMSVPAPFSDK